MNVNTRFGALISTSSGTDNATPEKKQSLKRRQPRDKSGMGLTYEMVSDLVQKSPVEDPAECARGVVLLLIQPAGETWNRGSCSERRMTDRAALQSTPFTLNKHGVLVPLCSSIPQLNSSLSVFPVVSRVQSHCSSPEAPAILRDVENQP